MTIQYPLSGLLIGTANTTYAGNNFIWKIDQWVLADADWVEIV